MVLDMVEEREGGKGREGRKMKKMEVARSCDEETDYEQNLVQDGFAHLFLRLFGLSAKFGHNLLPCAVAIARSDHWGSYESKRNARILVGF